MCTGFRSSASMDCVPAFISLVMMGFNQPAASASVSVDLACAVACNTASEMRERFIGILLQYWNKDEVTVKSPRLRALPSLAGEVLKFEYNIDFKKQNSPEGVLLNTLTP